jgi:hypothetical protein
VQPTCMQRLHGFVSISFATLPYVGTRV